MTICFPKSLFKRNLWEKGLKHPSICLQPPIYQKGVKRTISRHNFQINKDFNFIILLKGGGVTEKY